MDSTAAPAPPLASQIDPKLASALAVFGPWGALAGLALAFGLPFVDRLIANSHNSIPVTPDEWTSLKAEIGKSFDSL